MSIIRNISILPVLTAISFTASLTYADLPPPTWISGYHVSYALSGDKVISWTSPYDGQVVDVKNATCTHGCYIKVQAGGTVSVVNSFWVIYNGCVAHTPDIPNKTEYFDAYIQGNPKGGNGYCDHGNPNFHS